MNNFCQYHGVTEGSITLGIDSDSALDKAFQDVDIPSTWASYDILRMIRTALRESPLTWTPKKVEGHQDRHTPYLSLDAWGCTNVRVDRIAKRFWSQHPGPDFNPNPVKGRGWTLTIHGQEVTSNILRNIYYAATAPRIKRYWAKKTYIIHPDDSNNEQDAAKIEWVDWEGLGKMTEYVEDHICRWITKHLAHISPTNKTLFRRNERPTNTCPFCDKTETAEHIFTCPSAHTTKIYKEERIELRSWLQRNSSWDMTEATLEILDSIRQGRVPELKPTWSPQVQKAFKSQRQLSMLAFTCGLFHMDWREAQQVYKEKNKRKFTLASWMGLLAQKIWMMKWRIWRARTAKVHGDEEIQARSLAGDGIDEAIDEFFDMVPTVTIHMTRTQAKIFGADRNSIKQYRTKKKIRWLKKAMIHLESYEEYITSQRRSLSATRFRQHIGVGPNYQVQIERPPPYMAQDFHQLQLNEWRLPQQGHPTRHHHPQSGPSVQHTTARTTTQITNIQNNAEENQENTQNTYDDLHIESMSDHSQDQEIHTQPTSHTEERPEQHQLTLTQWLQGQGQNTTTEE